MKQYQDCYWDYSEKILTLGNGRVERAICMDDFGMTPLYLKDKETGKCWSRPEEECAVISTPIPGAHLTMKSSVENRNGLSLDHLAVDAVWENEQGHSVRRRFILYPGLPFISMRVWVKYAGIWRGERENGLDYSGTETLYSEAMKKRLASPDTIDAVPLPRSHYRLLEAMLLDKSDQRDTLVKETERLLYTHGWGSEEGNGNIFLAEDVLDGSALMAVKEAPSVLSMLGRNESDLIIKNNRSLQLRGTGLAGQALSGEETPVYGATWGVGSKQSLREDWLRLYRADWQAKDQVRIYSNTWGDRNQDKAVCHDFMLREIEMARRLGVQVVQIDDGWQKGHTANSALKKNGVWSGYYAQDPDFWQVNKEKFPGGLRPLVEEAGKWGMEMALWFSPDSSFDFANWEKDLATLLGLWKETGIRRFKLDGVRIASKVGEQRYVRLLEMMSRESGGQICMNQDITAQIRLGQIYFREYGNLFVENRYSDFGSYYPHNTLKNLWQLSGWVPSVRLQMECLNRGRNHDKYPEQDPFAPRHYDMDYLFAITIPSSPLIWMEMSHLKEEDARALEKIMAAYLPHQREIIQSLVHPIGEMPCGQSFTGFWMEGQGKGYLLLFRECTEGAEYDYCISSFKGTRVSFRILMTNDDKCRVEQRNGGEAIHLSFSRPRSYVFLQYQCQ